MEYEDCRIMELVRHAAREDVEAQTLLVEEVRCYIQWLVEHYGSSERAGDFAEQVLARVRRDYGQFWDANSEFGAWMDQILQREVETACRN
jgi:hypothetical protein